MPTTEQASLANEYRTITQACGLVDRSQRGKLALTGGEATEFLNGQVTNDVEALRPGKGCYAAFLTHKGKMLGDLRVLAVAANGAYEADEERPVELLLDTERVALQALFDMIRRSKIGYDVELHKRTLESGLLSLIGPAAEQIAARATGATASFPSEEHAHLPSTLNGVPVRLIRTDMGIDVLCDAANAQAANEALLGAGAVPASEAVAEIVRVERGRPRYGLDMDDSTIPQEAGINERAVSFTKGCYVGQETVARLYYRGKPNRVLRGLRLAEPTEPGAELVLGERTVGRLSSSVISPKLGPTGLGLVRVQAEPGTTVSVGEHGTTARVCELPFA